MNSESTASVNPLRKAGEMLGKLESREKTSTDIERIVSGEQEILYSFHSYTLDREVKFSQENLPDSFVDGYRQGMANSGGRKEYPEISGCEEYFTGGD